MHVGTEETSTREDVEICYDEIDIGTFPVFMEVGHYVGTILHQDSLLANLVDPDRNSGASLPENHYKFWEKSITGGSQTAHLTPSPNKY